MRVALFGYNWASQMTVTAQALRQLGCDVNAYARASRDNEGVEVCARPQMALRLLREMFRADVIHVMGGARIFPLRLELALLRFWPGIKVVEWMGSEVRMRQIEEKMNSRYWMAWRGGYEYRTEDFWHSTWIQIAYRLAGFRAVVNSIDLMRYCIFDVAYVERRSWQPKPTKKPTGAPVVVHCPTATVCKGTSEIESAITRLKSQGYRFIYRRVTGAHEVVLGAMAEAHVVIDQTVLGDIGMVSVEAMQRGCRVVARLKPDVALHYRFVYSSEDVGEAILAALAGPYRSSTQFDPIGAGQMLLRVYRNEQSSPYEDI